MKKSLRCLVSLLGFGFYAFAPLSGHAQDYPVKPITIVVGYTAGGGVDQMARILAEKLPGFFYIENFHCIICDHTES